MSKRTHHPDRGDLAMGILSADYDLWVNGSYMSQIAPQSAKAAYRHARKIGHVPVNAAT